MGVTAGGKGIYPYEKIISSDTLEIKSLGEFFNRTEFFGVLKQQKCFKRRLQNFLLFVEGIENKKS